MPELDKHKNPLFASYNGNPRSLFPAFLRRGLKLEAFKMGIYLLFPVGVVVMMLNPTARYFFLEVGLYFSCIYIYISVYLI